MNNEIGGAKSLTIINSQYAASAVRRDQYPEKILPQTAFIGRSNVGKSSLINSLCNRKNLARISGAPGKTQTLNFYEITAKMPDETREYFYLVDLPGYGYAKRSKTSRGEWSKFTEEYWLKSDMLKLVFQLIDIRHAPMESDINVYQWFVTHGVPVRLIATKADKISKGQIKKHLSQIAAALGMATEPQDIIAHSSATGFGREIILDVIDKTLF
jgi:GTP-binding protein